jgi:hypothetical protein
VSAPQPSFTLSGKALRGVRPAGHGLPSAVRLGCKGPRPGTPHPAIARLDLSAVNLPEEFDWADNPFAAQSVARMFRNDVLGTCVPAATWHILGVQAGKDARRLVAPTDAAPATRGVT